MLVTDQGDITEAFRSFTEWAHMGFDVPILLSDVEEAKQRLSRQEADAVAYLLPKDAGQDFFSFLSTHPEIVGMEAAGDHARLRRELGITRRILLEREEQDGLDDVLPMLQSISSKRCCRAGISRRMNLTVASRCSSCTFVPPGPCA